ncbi:MAG TPA: LysM peptidoglycan-binding domain-containing protein [Novosphingobium sp.]|nr:LysM peptidoglycan-binding domain-containing protein [Novosphingobium sp.]
MAEYLRYVVKGGDTLARIARDNQTTVGELVALNALADPDRIAVGQVLNIRRLSDTTYVIRRGDSLSAIAAHYNVTVSALAEANGIDNPDRIEVGTTLVIPTGGAASPVDPILVTLPVGGGEVPFPGAASVKSASIARQAVLPRSIGKCYRYVKRALLNGGAVGHYLGGEAANEAGPLLVREGFVDILGLAAAGIRSPYDAPVGAVIVYKATPTATDRNRIYGHIEIRTADGFASDYFSPRARTGARENGLAINSASGRVVCGVYVKPDVAAPASVAPAAVAPAAPPPAAAIPVAADPYTAANLNLPPANGKYLAAIIEAATRTDMAPQTIAAIIDAEAAKVPGTAQWDANSKAGTSSARGLTQFLDATWRGEAKRAGGLLNAEARAAGVVSAAGAILDDARLLAMRFDPRVSILAGADYAIANLAILRKAGVLPASLHPAGAAKLAYLSHHEGPTGAGKFLRGQMAYVKPGTIRANIPNESRRNELIAAAGGNIGTAYRTWLTGYVDTRIDVRNFMVSREGVAIPSLSSFYV